MVAAQREEFACSVAKAAGEVGLRLHRALARVWPRGRVAAIGQTERVAHIHAMRDRVAFEILRLGSHRARTEPSAGSVGHATIKGCAVDHPVHRAVLWGDILQARIAAKRHEPRVSRGHTRIGKNSRAAGAQRSSGLRHGGSVPGVPPCVPTPQRYHPVHVDWSDRLMEAHAGPGRGSDAAGTPIPEQGPAAAGLDRSDMSIDGMSCAACAAAIERRLAKKAGVASAHVNFATRVATVRYDPSVVEPAALAAAVDSLGYKATVRRLPAYAEGSVRSTSMSAMTAGRRTPQTECCSGGPLWTRLRCPCWSLPCRTAASRHSTHRGSTGCNSR